MTENVRSDEYVPRVSTAVGAAIAAAFAPGLGWKLALLSLSAGLLTTVATGYCPITALRRPGEEEPQWRTLKTFRVVTRLASRGSVRAQAGSVCIGLAV